MTFKGTAKIYIHLLNNDELEKLVIYWIIKSEQESIY